MKDTEAILEFLKEKNWTSPTQIGMHFGYQYVNASSWASRKCKKMVEQGFLERNDKGHYRLNEK